MMLSMGVPLPKLSFEPMELALRHPWTIARNSSVAKKNGLLTIEHDGIVAFGEAAPNVRYGQNYDSANEAFARVREAVAGLSPEEHLEWIARAEAVAGKDTEVVAALDMALWDLKGKIYNKPLWKLLEISDDSSRMPPTSYSLGIDEPERLKLKVKEAGDFPILKIKLGLGDDVAQMAAIREVTNKTLRADANEGWKSVSQTLEKLAWLREQGVELVEQPLPAADRHGAQAIWDFAPLPVVADESSLTIADLKHCDGAFHGVNIKLSKCGGVTRAREMAAAARALGFKLMIGCMIESSVGIAAAVALAPLFDWVDLDGNLLIENDPFCGLQIENGRWRLPRGPGLGIQRKT